MSRTKGAKDRQPRKRRRPVFKVDYDTVYKEQPAPQENDHTHIKVLAVFSMIILVIVLLYALWYRLFFGV